MDKKKMTLCCCWWPAAFTTTPLLLLLWIVGDVEHEVHAQTQTLRFSNVFQSHMVLQRDRPIKIWGFGAEPGSHVMVQLGGLTPVTSASPTDQSGGWEATLPPHSATVVTNGSGASSGLTLSVTSAKDSLATPAQTLEDVAIGDLFLFSGQSNIDIESAYANQFNETAQTENEEFANKSTAQIRIMIVTGSYVDEPSPELTIGRNCPVCPWPYNSKGVYQKCQCNSLTWARVNGSIVRGFSATAWYTGKALALAGTPGKGVPIGLIRSSQGGTPIEFWSSPDAIAKCPQSAQHSTSVLFNGMIAPLLGLEFKAVTWYQGESNTAADGPWVGPKYYSCALPALVNDWREKMQQPDLPIILVELSAYCNEHDTSTFHTWCDQNTSAIKEVDYHLPSMRLAQSSADGIEGTAIVSAMDLGSLHPRDGSIHSDKKVELGRRLGLAASAIAYNDTSVVWQGPSIVGAHELHVGDGDSAVITVEFKTAPGISGITFNSSQRCPPSILPVYCTGAGFEVGNGTTWVMPSSLQLSTNKENTILLAVPDGFKVRRVRYAYADWPVCSVRNAPLPSANGIQALPARIFDIPVSL